VPRVAPGVRLDGLRSKVDDGRRGSFGRRVTDWEMKACDPGRSGTTRLGTGPRDVVRRDTGEKSVVALSEARSLVAR